MCISQLQIAVYNMAFRSNQMTKMMQNLLN